MYLFYRSNPFENRIESNRIQSNPNTLWCCTMYHILRTKNVPTCTNTSMWFLLKQYDSIKLFYISKRYFCIPVPNKNPKLDLRALLDDQCTFATSPFTIVETKNPLLLVFSWVPVAFYSYNNCISRTAHHNYPIQRCTVAQYTSVTFTRG